MVTTHWFLSAHLSPPRNCCCLRGSATSPHFHFRTSDSNVIRNWCIVLTSQVEFPVICTPQTPRFCCLIPLILSNNLKHSCHWKTTQTSSFKALLNTVHRDGGCSVSNISSATFQAYFSPYADFRSFAIIVYSFLSEQHGLLAQTHGRTSFLHSHFRAVAASIPSTQLPWFSWVLFSMAASNTSPSIFPWNMQFSRLCCQLLKSTKIRVHQTSFSAKTTLGKNRTRTIRIVSSNPWLTQRENNTAKTL